MFEGRLFASFEMVYFKFLYLIYFYSIVSRTLLVIDSILRCGITWEESIELGK